MNAASEQYIAHIKFSAEKDRAYGCWLTRNLQDFEWSTNKNFRRDYGGGCQMRLDQGCARIHSSGAPREELESYLQAFARAMRKHGLPMLYTIEPAAGSDEQRVEAAR